MINIKIKYFIFCLIFVTHTFLFSNNDLGYKIDSRIIIQKGLSQSRIKCIIEDERGFMWFGTDDGLNRYDGYTFKIFRNNPNDSTSLHNNTINSMVEDDQGNIWIGTSNGITVFNPYSEIFKSFPEVASASQSDGSKLITSCVIDKEYNIWYSTAGSGIFKINTITHKKEHLEINSTDSIYLKNDNTLFIDSNNKLWISSYVINSVLTYNIEKKMFEKYPLLGIVDKGNGMLKINTFFEDDIGRIWLSIVDFDGMDGSLFYLDKNQKAFSNYKQFLSKKYINNSLDRFNSIVTILGNKNEIWFASMLGGIFKFEFGETPIVYYRQSPIKDARINCIYRSKNGILWIGTNGNGIELSVPNNTDFKLMSSKINEDFTIESIRAFGEDNKYYWVGGYYGLAKIKKDFSKVSTLKPESVYTIANSTNNNNILWTGSEGGGFKPLNKRTNKFIKLKLSPDEDEFGLYNHLFVIHTVSDTLLLLGSNNGVIGYNLLSKSTTSYPTYSDVTKSEVNKIVRTIYEDKSGNILVGFTHGGIGKIDFNKKSIEKFNLIPQMESVSNYNPVNSIYNDDKNRYWIATSNGLIMFDATNNIYKLFNESDGLPNSHIYGILPDEDGNIWVSTNNGLSCYSPIENTFVNYDISDGLQNNEFNTGAYFKAADNTLFFGGINGFNYFNPKEIKQNSIVAKLVITGVKISNNKLKIDKQLFLQHKLIIKPNEEVFTIEFAGLSFINSYKNQYKYKIKELNDAWVNLNDQHYITFNNMSHGTYTLEILASNNHGLWIDKPYVFTIEILPKFYESHLFIWLVIIFVILAIFSIYRIRVNSITTQKNKLEIFADLQTIDLRIANDTLTKEILKHKSTSKALADSNKTKDRFLSIMAHDIINPLGVILGFSDLLIDETNDFDDKDKKSFLKTINVTSKGLTSLLSNLLQWSRLQSGTITPKPQIIFLKSHIADCISLLVGNIIEKEINVVNNIMDETTVFADADMLSTILRNLISNAIKFTPVKGKITISLKKHNNMVEISIVDTGVGIPKENIDKLFNTNENISSKGTNNESGTGIGLGLVSDFVILNGGKIRVVSEVGKGSEFCFSLPIKVLKK